MIKRLTFIAITVVLLFVVVSGIFASPGTIQYLPIVANEPTLTPTNTPTPTPTNTPQTYVPVVTPTPTPTMIPQEQDLDLIQEKLYLLSTFGIDLNSSQIVEWLGKLGLPLSVGFRETCTPIQTDINKMRELPTLWDDDQFPMSPLPNPSRNYYITQESPEKMFQLGSDLAYFLFCARANTKPQVVLLTFGSPSNPINAQGGTCNGVRIYRKQGNEYIYISNDQVKTASLSFLEGFTKRANDLKIANFNYFVPHITLGIGLTNFQSYCELDRVAGENWAKLVNQIINCRDNGCENHPQYSLDTGSQIVGAIDFETTFNDYQPTSSWVQGFLSVVSTNPIVVGGTPRPNYLYSYSATGCPRVIDPSISTPPAGNNCGEQETGGYDWTTQQVLDVTTGPFILNMPQIYGASPGGHADGWLYVAWAAKAFNRTFQLAGVVSEYKACEQHNYDELCADGSIDNTPVEAWGYMSGTFINSPYTYLENLIWGPNNKFKSVSDMYYQQPEY